MHIENVYLSTTLLHLILIYSLQWLRAPPPPRLWFLLSLSLPLLRSGGQGGQLSPYPRRPLKHLRRILWSNLVSVPFHFNWWRGESLFHLLILLLPSRKPCKYCSTLKDLILEGFPTLLCLMLRATGREGLDLNLIAASGVCEVGWEGVPSWDACLEFIRFEIVDPGHFSSLFSEIIVRKDLLFEETVSPLRASYLLKLRENCHSSSFISLACPFQFCMTYTLIAIAIIWSNAQFVSHVSTFRFQVLFFFFFLTCNSRLQSFWLFLCVTFFSYLW